MLQAVQCCLTYNRALLLESGNVPLYSCYGNLSCQHCELKYRGQVLPKISQLNRGLREKSVNKNNRN